ncbi:MAG: hypothetical protein KC996_06950 [Phycisphaerales bacterium]|nr:hypothetical protein [Phycisphaerales bacterium]
MQPRFRTCIFTTAIALGALTDSSALAQTSTGAARIDPDEASLRERLDELDRQLERMPDDVADQVREGLEESGVLEDVRGTTDPVTRRWELGIPNTDPLSVKFDLQGNMIVVSSSGGMTRIEKYSIASNVEPELLWTAETVLMDVPTAFEIDLDGNVVVAGYSSATSNYFHAVKVNPQGFFSWQRIYTSPAPQALPDHNTDDIVIDPDGVIFLAVKLDVNLSDLSDRVFVYQLDPESGAVGFQLDVEAAVGAEISGFKNVNIEMDPSGRLYVLGSIVNQNNDIVARLDGGTGNVIWSTEIAIGHSSDPHADGLEASPQGGVVVAGFRVDGVSAGARGIRIDQDGNELWAYNTNSDPLFAFEQYRGAHAFRDGTVAFIGGTRGYNTGFPINRGIIHKIDQSGNLEWSGVVPGSDYVTFTSLDETFTHMDVDRAGNIYVMMRRYLDTVDERYYSVHKFDANGVSSNPLWTETQPPGPPLPASFRNLEPRGLRVDGGGNVLAVGARFESPQEVVIVKYTQPYLLTPTIQKTSASLSFENQSIWAPGMGNLVAEQDLFSIDWNEDLSVNAIFTVPLLGDFGGDFIFLTDGTLDTGVKAEINGGTVDVHMPVDLEFAIPSTEKVLPGSQLTIVVDWKADPAARMTSCFTPTFNAGLTAGVDYSFDSSLRLVAFSENLINLDIIHDSASIPRDYIPEANLLDILANAGYPTPGEWQSFESPDGIFAADFRTPQMFAQGFYNPGTNSFSTDAHDRFFRFSANITEAVLKPFGLTASAQFETGTPDGEFSLRGGGSVFQLGARADIGANQFIDVGVLPMVRYEFVGENISPITLPVGENLSFIVPNDGSYDGVIEIIPTLMGTGQFFNTTEVGMYPGITWKTVELNGAAAAFGFDLITFGPECLLCFDWDLSEILAALGVPNPDVVNFEIPVFEDGWDIPFNSVQLPCLRIMGPVDENGNPVIAPNIEAASRDSIPMLIYDQTSPSVSSFNVTTSGASNFLVFGERFASDSQVMIEHWGRVEALESVWVNNNTMLARLPNRFRLLPGIAKLYVQNANGVSDTIDLAITFPTPRLDAVNPNLWAADPDLATLPVSVIDAKSFAGNDTFIARRDYYIKLRDDLWSDITDGGFAGGAAEYFPGFDFNRMPEFPAVLWNAKGSTLPLPRFVQPVDNGIHNVRLEEGQYDIPMMVPVTICNPGPGGGMSNELMLTIAAPVPVASSIEPSNFSPVDIIMDDDYNDPNDVPVARPIELRVSGPAHVPNFVGYEEPKYGNFNASSVVRYDGVDLPTTFVSSSLLIAELPADSATLGDHWVAVHTPSNGTKYFEELRVDANADGIPDETPVFQGLLDSGGDSAPLLFRVRYRDPVVEAAVPNLIDQGSIAFDDLALKQTRDYNLTLIGADFRVGAAVFFNGQLRDSTVVGPGKMRVKLLPEDVATVGVYPVVVQNAGPDYAESEPILITVADLNLIVKKTP